MKNIKLIELGVDGGGFEVYQMEDGRVVETGSAGGMMNEEEDPIKSWENHYDSFEAFFEDFKEKQKDFWIHFYPLYISETIKPYIMTEVQSYKENPGASYHPKKNWIEAMERNNDH
jgi:hypothetical protein